MGKFVFGGLLKSRGWVATIFVAVTVMGTFMPGSARCGTGTLPVPS
jgi:hypothetical protein